MRVTKRFRSEESGAVLMIVAISLVVVIGMLVLVVDLGRMVAVKREMVRAADAAALAAAQECAFRHGSAAATSAASQIAATNHDGASLASPLIFVPSGECDNPTTLDTKLVTVELSTTVDMFFAGIFGISSGSVSAQATASWEAAGPIPISVNVVPLENCKMQPLDAECVIEYPKETLQEPRWGILDLAHWNQTLDRCPLSNSYVEGIIKGGGWPEPLPLNGDPPGTQPTYDCLDNGAQFASWMELKDHTFWFPVIDVPTSLTENGLMVGQDPACPKCNVVNANVIDFVQMQVLAVDKGEPGSTIVLTVKIIPSIPSSVPGIAIRLVD